MKTGWGGVGTWSARRVISNAGIMPTVCRLAGREYFDRDCVQWIENLQYSCSGLSFKFALKKKIIDYVWGGEISANVEKSYHDMAAGLTEMP